MKKRYALFLLLLGTLLPLARHARADEAQTRAATVEVRAAALEGFEQDGTAFILSEGEGTIESAPYHAGWEFIAVGVTWAEPLAEESHPSLAVRVSPDGKRWGNWAPLSIEAEDRPDGAAVTSSDLLFVQGRYVQLRASLVNPARRPLRWEGLRLTMIDGRPGPTAAELAAQARPTAPGDAPPIISRAAWGADEGLRFDSNGNELWPREYYSMRAFFVHHTASAPTYPDPAAAVRSIYYYHAVTNGWGDIGYHYVVDQFGNVYQGRYGTEQGGLVVEGGHALGYNRNTMGISTIGDFTNTPPGSASVTALKSILTDRAAQYNIDPHASVWLDGVGDISPDRWFNDSILGHRDSHSPQRTTCPGTQLYALLPEIRTYVADHLADAPVVQLVAPLSDAYLDGLFTVQANASPDIVRIEYHLDGSLIAASDGPPWSVEVDSRSLPAGTFTLNAMGYTTGGRTAMDERQVTVVAAVSMLDPTRTALAAPHAMSGGPQRVYLPTIRWQFSQTCTPLVQNSTFDTTNTEWLMLLGDYAARYVADEASSPPRSLRVGMAPGDNVPAWSSARLPVTIPADAQSATLTLRYLPQATDVGGTGRHAIGILDADGTYVESALPMALYNFDSWQSLTYDLSHRIGETLYLYVGVENTGANPVSLYVDDIQLMTCQP